MSANAFHVTNDAARIYGSLWKTKKINGVIIACDKRVPVGSTRSATFVTVEWSLPGRVELKELSSRLVTYVPNAEPEAVDEVAPPGDVDNIDDTAGSVGVAAAPVQGVELPQGFEFPSLPSPIRHPPSPPSFLPTPPSPSLGSPPSPVPRAPSPAPPAASTDAAEQHRPDIAQVAHGRTWVIDDTATKVEINGAIPHRLWYITDSMGERITGDDHLKLKKMSLLDVFLLMFPPDHLIKIITLTNRKLRAKRFKEITKGQLIKFFGIIIIGTRFVFGNRRDLWNKTSVSHLIDPLNFGGRTGMTKNRFDEIWSCIRFSDQPEERYEGESSMAHRWKLVDDFVDAFNEYRASNYSPSDRICVDESISRWYGLGGHWINCGLPNYVAMDRKPENGCEIQDACDGRSKVMIRLKLVKGAAENAALKSQDPGGLHGTRIMKFLVAPWANSGRVVSADSYFASVPCALALKGMGLRFIGVVKTATKEFPQTYLSTVELPQKGDYKGVLCIHPTTGYKLLAFVWVDRERRYFISNCCSLSPGEPYTRTRWRQVEDVTTNIDPERLEITIPQPKCAEEYYSSCAMIDRHNRSRQSTLDIEKKFRTQKWDMRVNLSILSIIIVDTWCVTKEILGERYEATESTFYTKLAEEMIENTIDEAHSTRSRTSNLRVPDGPPSCLDTIDGRVASGVGIHLTPTKKRRMTKGKLTNYIQQEWCSDCAREDKRYKTTYVCSLRRENGIVKKIAFCHPKHGRLCFRKHVEKMHKSD